MQELPQYMSDYGYFTDYELAGGAPQTMYDGNRSTLHFRSDDELDGNNYYLQTNSTLVLSGPPNCPELTDAQVILTQNNNGTINSPDMNGCDWSQVFGEVDTLPQLPWPSHDLLQSMRDNSDYTFDATELLVSDGLFYPGGLQRDTLIMTELEFLSSGGFRVSRYKYLMSPHLDMDLTQENTPSSPDGNHLETNGLGEGLCNGLMEINDCSQYEQALNRYHARTIANGFEEYIDSDIRGAHGTHHFDTHLFQYDPGNNSEFEPYTVSANSTAITTSYYFPNEPASIYVKGGPVLVQGTYQGKYSIITDEYMTYRRHAYPVNNASETPIDTIYCNIWLVGDLVNADATWSGEVASLSGVQPDVNCSGGSPNNMHLISGANIIIANTRANGATGATASGTELHINIHAAIFANNESFTIQYWQNSTSEYWNDWNAYNPFGGNPTYLADGNGNRYGTLTGSDDDRGNIYFWGSMVQRYRGYNFRNMVGPYNITPGIGMDKHYTWDDNLRCNPPVNAISAYLYGCTDPEATNYNPDATVDDGSCEYYYDLGDVNCDGTLNVLDMVLAANMVLADEYDEIADMNEDGFLNILDLVIMVNLVLYGEPSLCLGLTEVELWGEYYEIATTTEVVLFSHGLTGTIPPEIGCLTNLTYLSLYNNQLTGLIPPEIGCLTNLTYLSLSYNQLAGLIPPEIGNLTNLTYLLLYNNQLTGSIPSEIGNLTNLNLLYLWNNQLTGEIPPEVCDLIESNNLDINAILNGNYLINTCE